ncbi:MULTISPECIES: GNAT family N-acetyltransferase [Thalassospira]|jgi:phosphinothricin acetyltransferase|uniref:GNAT family N-acetyltransferase n=1 Tax=Thalassospira TaxID=168934 RepID=UPI000EE5C86F|nr:MULTISPECIES: GNAT family N-acetyltransferase [Thalassospira]MBR9900978.1 N-acetyltransferase [Rhodospirillales bacterium]MBO6807705.1 N-acetyltransferase [Thalassospira sp.]MBO6840230.1 N-acetyltransferase [Thalassospira sp.]MBS8272329.1 N-acetyltransferase [Thalassospira tepidiphila]HCK20002.1 GNAT family N-acetyltransferase [Thalassospira sp.]|tara:strand:+ start:893 stop:1471 length:579 start_codon:yes stop_codon:yes gene_type:complete
MTEATDTSDVLSDLIIRDAEPEDFERITEIYGHHVLHGLASFEERAPEIAELTSRWQHVRERGLPYLVADVDGRVEGFAYAGAYRTRPAYRFTVEDTIYIAPEVVGKGAGSALLSELIKRVTALGYRQMIAVIGDSANVASIGLHARLGFRVAGTLQSAGFKMGRWVDSVIMQRGLGDGDSDTPGNDPTREK